MILKTVRKCATRGCPNTFTQYRSFEKYCVDCATAVALLRLGKEKKAKAVKEKRADAVKKEKLKTRSDYIKEAQTAFNLYVRTRDAQKPCICCGKPLAVEAVGGGFDCGHYRSVGSAPHLRFEENNAHGQTKQCNRWGAGRAVDYRMGLIQRITPTLDIFT